MSDANRAESRSIGANEDFAGVTSTRIEKNERVDGDTSLKQLISDVSELVPEAIGAFSAGQYNDHATISWYPRRVSPERLSGIIALAIPHGWHPVTLHWSHRGSRDLYYTGIHFFRKSVRE